MAFTVHYAVGDKSGYDNFDDSHALAIRDWGLIEVTQEGRQVGLYSPNYWTKVAPAGENKGPGVY